jgi:hypothetical protein
MIRHDPWIPRSEESAGRHPVISVRFFPIEGDSARTLEFVVCLDGGSVEGQVLDGAKEGVAHAWVALAPVNPDAPDSHRTATTDLQGHYEFQSVRPGIHPAGVGVPSEA